MVNILESHLSLYISGLEPKGILKDTFLASLVGGSQGHRLDPQSHLVLLGANQCISGLLTQSVPYQSLSFTRNGTLAVFIIQPNFIVLLG